MQESLKIMECANCQKVATHIEDEDVRFLSGWRQAVMTLSTQVEEILYPANWFCCDDCQLAWIMRNVLPKVGMRV